MVSRKVLFDDFEKIKRGTLTLGNSVAVPAAAKPAKLTAGQSTYGGQAPALQL